MKALNGKKIELVLRTSKKARVKIIFDRVSDYDALCRVYAMLQWGIDDLNQKLF